MRTNKAAAIILVVLLAIALAIAIVAVAVTSTGASCSACLFAWKDDDMTTNTSVFTSTDPICLVIVKAATEEFTFSTDGCHDGYCVTGIGTYTGTATLDQRDCIVHDISHVSWYTDRDPTAVAITNVSTDDFSNKELAVIIIGFVLLVAEVIIGVIMFKKGS